MSDSTRKSRSLRRRRLWLFLGCLAAVALGSMWGCFASPVADLWPPKPGEPRHAVDVVYWDWHTRIVAAADPLHEDAEQPARSRFTEWGFGEERWYLDGHQGFTGVFRALCWPTDSCVGRSEDSLPYWQRYRSRELERWSFVVSSEGLARMNEYLESLRGSPIEAHPGWYSGRRSYCLFFACHHFTLSALRAAGLPVRPWWGFTAWQTRIQLDRVARFHEAEGLLPASSAAAPPDEGDS
ncbi:MAG: DUF2459 domain-containing protein [Planctomycetes bacterium]|nr:DUF2459 domain-containing protein [Planctomycetota bacterium]